MSRSSFTGSTRRKRGFTLIELLVVVAIIAIIADMSMHALSMVRKKARKAVCMNQMKQVGLAEMLYSQDWDGIIALRASSGSTGWYQVLMDNGYIPQETYFNSPGERLCRCPSLLTDSDSSYQAYGVMYDSGLAAEFSVTGTEDTWTMLRLYNLDRPTDHILVADTVRVDRTTHEPDIAAFGHLVQRYQFRKDYYSSWCRGGIHLRHSGAANALLADGHVESVVAPDVKELGVTGCVDDNGSVVDLR